MSFIQQWDWVYGKTPKFSISATETFQFGQLVSHITVMRLCSVSNVLGVTGIDSKFGGWGLVGRVSAGDVSWHWCWSFCSCLGGAGITNEW